MAEAPDPLRPLQQSTLDDEHSGKGKRKSYTRETKLKVVEYYRAHESNLYKTSKTFQLNTKTVLRWIKDEKKIRDGKKGSKHIKHDRPAMYPDVEEKLRVEYRELRKKGLKVKGWWFRTRAKQIFKELHPDKTLSFQTRSLLVSRLAATSACVVAPIHARGSLLTRNQQFHQAIRHEARNGESVGQLGRFKLSQIANIDQTPLPFTFTDGTTYDDTGASIVWVRGGSSGLDKRQCTV